MKKALLWILGIVVSLWALLWAVALFAERKYASREWPENLGRAADVPGRYPETKLSASAAELMRLAAAAALDLGPQSMKDRPVADTKVSDAIKLELGEWGGAQLAKTSGPIDPAPAKVAEYLTTYQPQLDAVRDYLLRGEPLVWPSNLALGMEAPIPNLLGHMQVTRVFVARALEKARANDPAAWEELHAAWNLNRGLWKGATLIETLIALATTRMLNAAAMKAPGEEPAWYAEVRAVDSRKAMLTAHQAEAWMFTRSVSTFFASEQDPDSKGFVRRVTQVLGGGYLRLSAANAAEHMRLIATDAAGITQCDFKAEGFATARLEAIPRWNIIGRIAIPNLGSAWQRVMRYQAELEATERIHQLKRGQTPVATSRCSDGTWQFTTNPDGSRTVRFSRDIPVPAPGVKYPLEYTVGGQ